ncbi:MAG: HypC/HybG/HupF family hydrogenase formation chaperone [Lentisphaerae bacterium]|nr:HypC/HybG/HupF family hydrogenase formation chaperone [Lentisphaerota bacterium]
MKIVELDGQNAVVEADGVRIAANVAFIQEPATGDHVLVHAGFAIQKWSDEDVKEYDEIMSQLRSVE